MISFYNPSHYNMPKEVQLRKKGPNKSLQCKICNHYCVIATRKTWRCGVHKNVWWKMELLVYGKALGVHIDPMEKKPLYHFFPGTNIFSFGTAGCNFTCKFCQNRQMSQAKEFPEIINEGESRPPEKIVNYCIDNNIKSIAYTYNEPTIFFEYAYDTMKLAKKAWIKNVRVTNGFMSKECRKKIEKLIDAVNIDIKGYTEDFYRDICWARLQPVLDNVKWCQEHNIRTEVTTLVIPWYNDKDEYLEGIAKFIYSISPDMPWHLSAFYPAYKILDVPNTPIDMLQKWYDIGKKVGLHYIYMGNIWNNGHEDTICPKCGLKIIERLWFSLKKNSDFKDEKCPKCGFFIAGRRK